MKFVYKLKKKKLIEFYETECNNGSSIKKHSLFNQLRRDVKTSTVQVNIYEDINLVCILLVVLGDATVQYSCVVICRSFFFQNFCYFEIGVFPRRSFKVNICETFHQTCRIWFYHLNQEIKKKINLLNIQSWNASW
jgi:hypothetical protein